MEYKDASLNEIEAFDIESFTDKSFIKWEDGTTAFNVYTMGQNIAHDMWADGYFDEDDIIIYESDILDWINDKFKNIYCEIMKEIKYQLIYNPDINQGNINIKDEVKL